MEVTEVSGNTLTVVRGLEDTNETSHASGSKAENRLTAGTYEELVSSEELGGVEQKVDAHLADYVHQGEVHGLRVIDGKFECFDGQDWKQEKGSGGLQVGTESDFNAVAGNGEVTLTWGDPEDVTIEDTLGNIITIARWAGTKIVRKTGSYPVDENDGILILDNKNKNQYQSNGYVDDGLTNGTTYFYM